MPKPVDQNHEGMEEIYQSTPWETKDTDLGNLNGNVVDNSAGEDPTTVNKTYQMGQKGANFGFNHRSSGSLYTDGN